MGCAGQRLLFFFGRFRTSQKSFIWGSSSTLGLLRSALRLRLLDVLSWRTTQSVSPSISSMDGAFCGSADLETLDDSGRGVLFLGVVSSKGRRASACLAAAFGSDLAAAFLRRSSSSWLLREAMVSSLSFYCCSYCSRRACISLSCRWISGSFMGSPSSIWRCNSLMVF